jgi:hypothetical protein
VNTIYGRWWHPLDEQPGKNPVPGSSLPWTGDYEDGLGNKISMLAYANPTDIRNERQRGDGFGIVRFDKRSRRITFECWPRFSDAGAGDGAQFAGWPVTIAMSDNDGRQPAAWLPELRFENVVHPVVQIVEEQTGEVLYTVRVGGDRFQPAVYAKGKYTIKAGRDRPASVTINGIEATDKAAAGQRTIEL